MVDVLIADDEELVRHGLATILDADPDIRVVALARDGAEAVSLARAHRPDVVLMDLRMPGTDGLAAISPVIAASEAKVIMLTTFDSDDALFAALREGASGFLLKDIPPPELIQAVRTVAEGNAILSPAITGKLITRVAASSPPPPELAGLTGREREVLGLLSEGLSNADIGVRLRLSEATVKVHVGHVLEKLRVANRVQAAVLAHRAGI